MVQSEASFSGISIDSHLQALRAVPASGVSAQTPVMLVYSRTLEGAHVPNFPPSAAALIAPVEARDAVYLRPVLAAAYPPEHGLYWVFPDAEGEMKVEASTLAGLEQGEHLGPLCALWLPPISPAASFEAFQEVIAHLRAPDGCPWDREQTHASLRSGLLEETYEVLDTIDANDMAALQEELGDLLLHIVMQAQIAAEEGAFNAAQVVSGIHNKIVRRHPHVFGDMAAGDAQAVLQNWERVKASERAAKGKGEASLLDGIARALPALTQAEQIQKRAGHVGFDWHDIQGVLDKVNEEMVEVQAAQGAEDQAAEIGDLLFAVVNLARWYKVDSEAALRATNARFRRRFAHIEAAARAQGRQIGDMTLDEMEALWQEAKGN